MFYTLEKRCLYKCYLKSCLYVYLYFGNARGRDLVQVSRENEDLFYNKTVYLLVLYMHDKVIGYLE